MDKETLNVQNCVKELHARRKFLLPATIELYFCAIALGGVGALAVSMLSPKETGRIVFGIIIFSVIAFTVLGFAIYQTFKSVRTKKWIDQGQFYIVEDRLAGFGYANKYALRKSMLDISAKKIVDKSDDGIFQSKSIAFQTYQAGKYFIFEQHGKMYPNVRNYDWSQSRSTNYQYEIFNYAEVGDIYYVLVFAKDKKHRPVQAYSKKFFQWKDPHYTVAPIQNETDE